MSTPLDILIVDDNPEVLVTIREILELDGHHVRAFTDGAQAVADFERRRAALVITDLGMPEVTGWQVARAIRNQSPQTPIVFITAIKEHVDDQALHELGIAAVLRKPFRIAQMSDVLRILA